MNKKDFTILVMGVMILIFLGIVASVIGLMYFNSNITNPERSYYYYATDTILKEKKYTNVMYHQIHTQAPCCGLGTSAVYLFSATDSNKVNKIGYLCFQDTKSYLICEEYPVNEDPIKAPINDSN